MRLHNFFIDQKIGEQKNVRITDVELLHQLKNVFRLDKGAEIVFLDNSGFQYRSKVELLSKNEGVFEILEVTENKIKPAREIFLYVSMIKKDNFEWILEKGTEIGVTHFIPVISGRSIKMNFNNERGLKILKEASEQSKRAFVPELQAMITLDEALKNIEENKIQAVAFHVEDGLLKLEDFTPAETVAIFIGPEGGWSETEIEQFRKHDVALLSLGEATLRAETAAIVASTLFLL